MAFFVRRVIRYAFYILLLGEILFLYFSNFERLSLILFSLLLIALWLRYVITQRYGPNVWTDVREKLKVVLIANSIIPGAPTLSPLDYPKPIFIDEGETKELSIQINPSIIEDLRFLGLDGILICLYLLKHRESYCSIRTIQKDLRIPTSTIYRNIQRLVDNNYISPQYSFDDPKRAFYQIAYEGETLMFDFYDLINIDYREPYSQSLHNQDNRN